MQWGPTVTQTKSMSHWSQDRMIRCGHAAVYSKMALISAPNTPQRQYTNSGTKPKHHKQWISVSLPKSESVILKPVPRQFGWRAHVEWKKICDMTDRHGPPFRTICTVLQPASIGYWTTRGQTISLTANSRTRQLAHRSTRTHGDSQTVQLADEPGRRRVNSPTNSYTTLTDKLYCVGYDDGIITIK